MNLDLAGKTALATASSGGIGLEIARSLAADGARVVINGRTQASVDKAIADIKSGLSNADLVPLAADAGTAGGSDAAVDGSDVGVGGGSSAVDAVSSGCRIGTARRLDVSFGALALAALALCASRARRWRGGAPPR